jgi:hypothetical protein
LLVQGRGIVDLSLLEGEECGVGAEEVSFIADARFATCMDSDPGCDLEVKEELPIKDEGLRLLGETGCLSALMPQQAHRSAPWQNRYGEITVYIVICNDVFGMLKCASRIGTDVDGDMIEKYNSSSIDNPQSQNEEGKSFRTFVTFLHCCHLGSRNTNSCISKYPNKNRPIEDMVFAHAIPKTQLKYMRSC